MNHPFGYRSFRTEARRIIFQQDVLRHLAHVFWNRLHGIHRCDRMVDRFWHICGVQIDTISTQKFIGTNTCFRHVIWRSSRLCNRCDRMVDQFWHICGAFWQKQKQKMVAIRLTTFQSNYLQIILFKFHWNLFPIVQLTMNKCWSKWWLGTEQATSR